ncbi:sodium-coupled monocarboxylate transporter 1-like [Procambarus clarkii]|uniref:sodium-coupled monocarboxylate transporter 1-like n=1 Tax=Procambarus clarkii TaxID=6728 RepID=UPI0037420F1A
MKFIAIRAHNITATPTNNTTIPPFTCLRHHHHYTSVAAHTCRLHHYHYPPAGATTTTNLLRPPPVPPTITTTIPPLAYHRGLQIYNTCDYCWQLWWRPWENAWSLLRMDGTDPQAEGEPMSPDPMSGSKFTVVDYGVFGLLLVVSAGIGVYSALRGRGVSSTQQYLLGGRHMPVLPVALSLLGGAISAISILGSATEIYFYGTQLTMSLFGFIFGVLMIRNIILPVLYPLHLVSIFEYIEMRFQSRTLHKMVTVMQLLASFVYSGICLYAPSITLSSVTSLPIWASIVTMGLICSFYTTIGGVKAVVYTDVVQTLLMFGGVLVVSVICCLDLGGPAGVWDIADQGGRIEFFNMDPSPFVRHTFWSTQVLGAYLALSVAGVNQPQFQRFISVKSLQLSQSLCMLFIVGSLMLWSVFYISGLVAYAVYSDCDPLTSGRIEKPDQIMPYLVADKLRHLKGMSGLFVAAVYGGALSSLSSYGNAIACMIWVDFLKDRPNFKNISNRNSTNIIKLLSTMTGVVAIFLGLLVGNLGTIFHVTNALISVVKGPLIGIFLAGICAPMAVQRVYKIIHWASASTTPSSPAIDSVLGSLNNTRTLAPKSSGHSIYDISYCYTGVIGILNTLIFSSIVSFITGPVAPEEVDPRVVNATCLRLYQRLWGLAVGKSTHQPHSVFTPAESKAQVHGLSTLQDTDQVQDQTTDQAYNPDTDQAHNKASDQAHNKASDQAHNKASDQAHNKASDQAHNKASDQAHNKASDQAHNKASDQAHNKASDQAHNKASDQAHNKASDQAHNKASDQAHNKASDQAHNKASDQAHNKASDQAHNKASDQAHNKASDQAHNKASDQAHNKASDQAHNKASDQAHNKASDQVQNQAIDQVQNQAIDQIQNQATDQVQNQASDQVQNQASH